VDYGVDNRAAQPTTLRLTCANEIHGLCTRKSRSRFGRRLSTEKSTGSTNLPVEKGCGQSVGPAFPQISNGPLITVGDPRGPNRGHAKMQAAALLNGLPTRSR
jgi:hypothetical protein